MLHIVACLYLSSQLYYMGRVKKLIGGWSNHRATHCSVFISQLSVVLHGESEETDRWVEQSPCYTL